MREGVEFKICIASEKQVIEHLLYCDADFIPPLSQRVEINLYAKKIIANAIRFEAWFDYTLIGLVAVYCNDNENHTAFITSVSVLRAWLRKGIAERLIKQCVKYAIESNIQHISLEVARNNIAAVSLYEKLGFIANKTESSFVTMSLHLSE